MVPDTPVKATIGLQGVTLHKGWFISDDVSAARFDMNFDPVSITTYWALAAGTEWGDPDSSNDDWQIVASGAYKAENMDARLTFGYERLPNDVTTADHPESDDLFLVMGEFNMSFDMFSFFVIAGKNFGEAEGDGPRLARSIGTTMATWSMSGPTLPWIWRPSGLSSSMPVATKKVISTTTSRE